MEKTYLKSDNYTAFTKGQEIEHKVLGKGVVVDFPENVDRYDRWYHYVEVKFEGCGEPKIFLPNDLLEMLKK